MTLTMRLATPADAGVIAAIYAPFCTETIVSFEYAAPSEATMTARIRETTQRFPWLVLEDDGAIGGYAYAGEHSPRAAFAAAATIRPS